MRRSTRLGLLALAALLVIVGAYSAFWFVAAGRIKESVATWAQSARADETDASWHKIRVTGFPLAFRADLVSAVLRDEAVTPSPELRIPVLSGTAHPWDFANWRLAASEGFTAELAAGGRAAVKLVAQAADGVVSIAPEGGWKLWLTLQDTTVEAAGQVRVGSADAMLTIPPRPPAPACRSNLGPECRGEPDKIAGRDRASGRHNRRARFRRDGKGRHLRWQAGRCASRLAGCRRHDRTRQSAPQWGALGATATGTISLDQELQPIGGLSGAVQGYDQILTTLVQAGQMRAERRRSGAARPDDARQGRTGRQAGDQDLVHDPERPDVPGTGEARQGAPYHLE